MPKLFGQWPVAFALAVLSAFAAAGSAQADKPFPYVYVANTMARNVLAIDTGTNAIAATIPLTGSVTDHWEGPSPPMAPRSTS